MNKSKHLTPKLLLFSFIASLQPENQNSHCFNQGLKRIFIVIEINNENIYDAELPKEQTQLINFS